MPESYQEFSVVRKGEKDRPWYRNSRVVKNASGWFICTREGIDVGPYTCEFDAEVDAEILIKRLSTCAPGRSLQVIANQKELAATGETRLDTKAYTDYLIEEGGLELLHEDNSGRAKFG